MISRGSFKSLPFCDPNDNQVIFFLILFRFLKFIFNSSSTRCCINIREEDTVFKILLQAFIDSEIFTYPLELTCWCLRQVVVNKVLRKYSSVKTLQRYFSMFQSTFGIAVVPCLLKVMRKEMELPQLLKLESQAEQHTNSFCVVMTEQIWLSLSSIHSPNRFMWEGKKKMHLVLQYFQYWQ